jgi:hypothetical protein
MNFDLERDFAEFVVEQIEDHAAAASEKGRGQYIYVGHI